MLPPRSVPRVSLAVLTLGGAAGCGEAHEEDQTLEERAATFCESLADCGVLPPEDVPDCAADYYFQPSYVDAVCRVELNELFGCLLDHFDCADYSPEECSDEAYDAAYTCEF